MAYQSHHCSTTLPCSVCLIVFLHTCLSLSILLPFMLCAPCPFNAPFLFCVFQLLHTASFYMPESLSTLASISYLFCVFILSVHLLRPPCTVPLHALHHATVLLIGLFTASPLFLYFARSSLKKKTASRFCLFLICYSSLSFISHCAYCWFHTAHTVIFPSLQFNSFFIQNSQPRTVTSCFFYTLQPLQLPLKP
jgi:hypothetical protein